MSRRLDPRVPEPARRRLEDDPADHVGLTILVLTVAEERWPHLAMVSVGELVVVGADRLALALWPASTSAANLGRSGQATLALVCDGSSYSLRCRSDDGRALGPAADHPPLRGFGLRVVEVLEDVAPYADLLAGVTYRLHDPKATLSRWSATRAALHAAFGGA
jgi:hypothetical protein